MSYRAKETDEDQRFLRNKRLSTLEQELTQIGLKMLLSVDQQTYWKLLEKFKSVSQELRLYDSE